MPTIASTVEKSKSIHYRRKIITNMNLQIIAFDTNRGYFMNSRDIK